MRKIPKDRPETAPSLFQIATEGMMKSCVSIDSFYSNRELFDISPSLSRKMRCVSSDLWIATVTEERRPATRHTIFPTEQREKENLTHRVLMRETGKEGHPYDCHC